MPWKIVPADYDPTDRTTLHDDELIAIARALTQDSGLPQNEYNPVWRALQKVRPLAVQCDGTGDPTGLLPPGAQGTSQGSSLRHYGAPTDGRDANGSWVADPPV
jgi:hypothetical protein